MNKFNLERKYHPIDNIPIITKQEFKNLEYNNKYGYIEKDLPEDCYGRKFLYNGTFYGLEYRSGCFYPFLISLKNPKSEIPSNNLSLGIFQ